ncbi:hypothetical protein BC332_16686 [Capsicum chinense]|nr:hypothetical protein BC332_16686 [Capsicum chinense]
MAGDCGEAESLQGKIDPKNFGDRVSRSTLPEKLQKRKGERFVSDSTMQNTKKSRIQEESSVLNWMEAEEGGVYKPKTKETKSAYEAMLSLIQQQLCGQPLNIVCAASDEILAVLKGDNMIGSDKKKMEIEKVLNERISNQVFDKFVSIGRFITDYQCDRGDDEALYDVDVGVAVDFEDNEDEEESDFDEVPDDDEEDDDDYVQLEANDVAGMGSGIDADEGMTLNVRNIDAYWLQRKISEAYEQQQIDLRQSQKLAEDVFKILAEGGDDREVETNLLVHLQYEKFNLIQYLMRNRLKRDRKNLEKSLREEARQVKDMTGADGEDHDNGWLMSQRPLLDLDTLAFPQGGLLMANENCEVPAGTYRNRMKGYEEVHVPALKPKLLAPGENLVYLFLSRVGTTSFHWDASIEQGAE